ncbi:MAG: antitoxin MazE-like protein [Terracidiphilus sp.]
MPHTTRQQILNVRIDPALRSEFALAARAENRTVAEALRELIRAYVAAARQRRFASEARRQSRLIAGSKDESEVMRWMQDVSAGNPE